MPRDALDPGIAIPGFPTPYPWFPRRADGSPAWSDTIGSDGESVPLLDGTSAAAVPRGLRSQKGVIVDVTPGFAGVIPTLTFAQMQEARAAAV